MPNIQRRGKAGGQVSDWADVNDGFTPIYNSHFNIPHGLYLRKADGTVARTPAEGQITSSSTVITIPPGIEWVYVIMAGAGGAEYFSYGGMPGEVAWGWTLAQNTCIIGAGGAVAGGFTRYGHIMARGGVSSSPTGATNFYGMPGGQGFGDNNPANGVIGINAGGGGGTVTTGNNLQGGLGADGISGGRGGRANSSTGTSTGGNGGSGLVGGGGGLGGGTTTGTRTGGNGGNGLGIDGTVYTGGTGASQTNANGGAGGGAGIAGNGSNASGANGGAGGLGGGGAGAGGNNLSGGAGILYIFY